MGYFCPCNNGHMLFAGNYGRKFSICFAHCIHSNFDKHIYQTIVETSCTTIKSYDFRAFQFGNKLWNIICRFISYSSVPFCEPFQLLYSISGYSNSVYVVKESITKKACNYRKPFKFLPVLLYT